MKESPPLGPVEYPGSQARPSCDDRSRGEEILRSHDQEPVAPLGLPQETVHGPADEDVTLDDYYAMDSDEQENFFLSRYAEALELVKAENPHMNENDAIPLALIRSWTIPYGVQQLNEAITWDDPSGADIDAPHAHTVFDQETHGPVQPDDDQQRPPTA